MRKLLACFLVIVVLMCSITFVSCETGGHVHDFDEIWGSSPGGIETVVSEGNGYLVGEVLRYMITSEADKTCSVSGVSQQSKKNIDIPDKIRYKGKVYSVTSIGDQAFYECKSLGEIAIPESVAGIGKGAFTECSSLTEITIPESVTSIGWHAFGECTSLTQITIPNSVTSIGGLAFTECSSLTEITIPESVTSIGNYAFEGCSTLSKVVVKRTAPPSLGSDVFSSCSSDLKIYVPTESVEKYKSADEWSVYASKIVGGAESM